MRLRSKTNQEIFDENKLPYNIISNVVEEENTRNKIRATCEIIAKFLAATLGPYGSSTIIQNREGNHFMTKDGYDLMNRITFDDEVSRTILDLLRRTASDQVLNVGDGSTSAIIVANALYQVLTDNENHERLRKISPKDIVDILNDLSDLVEEELKKMARPLSEDMHELDLVTSIANNNDYETGKLIADIYRQVGEYGFISMDTLDRKEKDEYEIKKGIEWDRGYVDPVFGVGYEGEKVIYDNVPRIIICSSTITYDDLEPTVIPLMQAALNVEGAELVFVYNDATEDVVNFFKTNRMKHHMIGNKSVPMEFTPVDIAVASKESKNTVEDLALLCGCKIWDKNTVTPAEILKNPHAFVGRISKAIITRKSTQIIGLDEEEMTPEHRKKLESQLEDLRAKLAKMSNIEETSMEEDLEIYQLRKRVANLTASTAILHIGGRTLAERSTRQRLIEDSIFAGKSAMKYGIIPGGNLCIPKILLDKKYAICDILGTKYKHLPEENVRVFLGYFIDEIRHAFEESFRNVLLNSYMSEEEADKIIEECLTENKFYNLKLHRFENWDETEVVNSVMTDINILKSCMSIISILSTSNQFITINLNVADNIKK